MHESDVVVVGAGPAGSTAAREIVARGYSVTLLDRARFPRDKPCGGGVTIRTAALLPFSLDPVIEDVVYGARVRIRDGRDVTREYEHPLTYMTQRSRLDRFLVEQAQEAGVEFHDAEPVRAVERTPGGAFKVLTNGTTYRARFVVGADGANGIVGSALGYEDAEESAVALEGNLPFPGGVPGEFRGYVVLNFGYTRGGYGWIFPKGDHVNVGVGAWKADAGKRLRPALRRICELYGLDHARLESLRGHHLPLQRRGMAMAAGGSAVIGDAAGLVDPLSGEGIYAAILSGAAVAEGVNEYLSTGCSSLPSYQRALQERLIPELNASRSLMEILHACPEPFIFALQHSGRVWNRCCELVRGDTDYDGIVRTFGRIGAVTLGPTARLARMRTGQRLAR